MGWLRQEIETLEQQLKRKEDEKLRSLAKKQK
jgi:hypothetical protein